MEEPKTLKDILQDGINQAELSINQLAELSGIPERFINAFLGETTTLPAAPYIRGYLVKISKILNLNSTEIWQVYERENKPRSSGAFDKLPLNRFSNKKTVSKKTIIGILVGIFILSYIGFNAQRFWSAPIITFNNPEDALITTSEPSIILRGAIKNTGDSIFINEVPVYINELGEFQKEFSLDIGVNTFEVVAKRFLGRETRVMRQVVYEPLKDGGTAEKLPSEKDLTNIP